MKQLRWILISLIVGQPILVALFRTQIRRPVAVHYSLFGPDAWVRGDQQGFWVALTISFLLPLLILAMTTLPTTPIQSGYWWLRSPREVFIYWLGVSDPVVLTNLYLNSKTLTMLWFGINLLAILALLAYGVWLLKLQKRV
ncbi:hypothetical protein ACFQH1_12035 [Lactiplantibacillus daoliensis]|uniref:Integral membrane protein n=1 Tax=Lactiplantibacillus daoliensis TaxID=2559916 RepID=A0ABW1UJ68_9LACO|nr:hypothetical protein [Lactiplantibacillus daoliensis]